MLRTLWGSLQALFAFFSLGTARFAAYLRKAPDGAGAAVCVVVDRVYARRGVSPRRAGSPPLVPSA